MQYANKETVIQMYVNEEILNIGLGINYVQ